MASRKLNVLLYTLTGEAESLQSGSSGVCEYTILQNKRRRWLEKYEQKQISRNFLKCS